MDRCRRRGSSFVIVRLDLAGPVVGLGPTCQIRCARFIFPGWLSSARNAPASTVELPTRRRQTSGDLHFWIAPPTAKYQKAGSWIIWSFVRAHTLASCVGCDLKAVPA